MPAPPGPDEVAIAVDAAGVNYADCVTRMGLYKSAATYVGWPITPGFEVAGRVVECGRDVQKLELGSEVLAVTRFGGYAERVVVPETQAFVRPPGLDATAAAGMPTIFLSAWYALEQLAAPRVGDSVLVHSAAGGVGSALVQLARLRGCRVVGVVGRAHKREQALALGADAVVVGRERAAQREIDRLSPSGYAAVFDANGPSSYRASYRRLAPMGRLVIYGSHEMLPRGGRRINWPLLAWRYLMGPRFNPFDMANSNRSVMAFNLSYLFECTELLKEAMDQVMEWYAEDAVRMPALSTYPLDRVAEAHRALETGETVGKLVLVTSSADSIRPPQARA